MNAAPTSVEEGPPGAWWRGRWGVFALAVFWLQIAAIWAVSGRPEPPVKAVPTRGPIFLPDAPGDPAYGAWRWLLTPSLFVLPSAEDFSGPAWLGAAPQPIEVESFVVPERPLPWGPVRGPGTAPALVSRIDPGLAVLWNVPTATLAPLVVPPVRLPTRGQVRVIEGLEGHRLVGDPSVGPEPLAGGEAARPVVVRVAVDETSGWAAPPVIWESSEVPAVDEAALRLVRELRFTASGSGRPSWGLIRVEWPMAPEAVASPPNP